MLIHLRLDNNRVPVPIRSLHFKSTLSNMNFKQGIIHTDPTNLNPYPIFKTLLWSPVLTHVGTSSQSYCPSGSEHSIYLSL